MVAKTLKQEKQERQWSKLKDEDDIAQIDAIKEAVNGDGAITNIIEEYYKRIGTDENFCSFKKNFNRDYQYLEVEERE